MTDARFVNVVIPPLMQSYTYEAGSFDPEAIEVGHQVKVPLGRRTATGFVIEKVYELAEGITPKPVIEVLGPELAFDPGQIPFFRWIAKYYGDSLANVIDAAVPPRVTTRVERYISLNPDTPLNAKGKIQQDITALLHSAGEPVLFERITSTIKNAASALSRMEKSGAIVIERRGSEDSARFIGNAPAWALDEVTLNEPQQKSVEAICDTADAGLFKPFVLHGVTGSGKTEVYIEAIRHVASCGKGALVIVPEIALTPQLVDRFRARLGDNLAVLHSGLNKRLRWESWRALLEGRTTIAIGARSGIFAPVRSLGLIIVDEEHDGSYKQQESLRYNARDIALARGQAENCPVVLGSATPSLETYHHAMSGKYTYLSLPSRHLPSSTLSLLVVDLNAKKPWEMASKNVSSELYNELAATVGRGDQSFVLYNRRGFSNYLQCDTCEYVVECKQCSVTLTYHKQSNAVVCHYCNFAMRPPQRCPECEARVKSAIKNDPSAQASEPGSLVYRGAGTEKIFDELRDLLPGITIERLDRDAASDESHYRAILDRVRSGETKVLVGTQMIAKGHDLPGVTLVGVVDCDVGLHMPDFRAGERVFQLLTQAGGRAGRAEKPGKVILQTRVPGHVSIAKTLHQDYIGFAKEELSNRRSLQYPPFTRLLRIIASSSDKDLPSQLLYHLRDVLQDFSRTNELSVSILGPAPAPIAKLRGQWRWHLLLKSARVSHLHQALYRLKKEKTRTQKIRVTFDIDPQDMM